jgi:hypothetical protein
MLLFWLIIGLDLRLTLFTMYLAVSGMATVGVAVLVEYGLLFSLEKGRLACD